MEEWSGGRLVQQLVNKKESELGWLMELHWAEHSELRLEYARGYMWEEQKELQWEE
jgi:hypothetical protein